MFLAIDIGNTNVKLAVIKGSQIVEIRSIENRSLKVILKKELLRIKGKFPYIKNVLVCSVVPHLLKSINNAIKGLLKIKPLIVGKDLKVPLKNNYRNPSQVGQDRLVCAYAAKNLYGFPSIVIDFGTAITIDVISKKGHYEGGIIVPGIRLSIESLYSKAALLPNIRSVKGPKNLIGRDTKESILSGIFYGYGTMCNGLIDSLEKKLNGKIKIIVTGGHIDLMKKYITKKFTKIDKDLVFKGMAMLYHSFNRR